MNIDNIVIVLVEPGSPGNIGSSARAMKNMGFKTLRLVNPVSWRDIKEYQKEAEKMAWGAIDLLNNAEQFDTLEDAITDVECVVGTSAKPGRYREPMILSKASDYLVKRSRNNKIAILFGPESRGLSTEELSYCQKLITIPTSLAYPTLNLSQTVLLVCYHLNYISDKKTLSSSAIEEKKWASQEIVLEFFRHARRVLLDIGFLNKQNPEHGLEIFKIILGRSGITSGEIRTLRGVLRQIDWSSHRWTPPLW